MEGQKNKILGGVIVIGSLLWEDDKNCVDGQRAKGLIREAWRKNNLDLKQSQIVSLPVRYGRFSGKANRKNTYTMVLSREYWLKKKKAGKGVIVPFKNFIDSKSDLESQAIKLAMAEVFYKEDESPRLICDWGVVAIWINPESPYKKIVSGYWKKIISDTNLGYPNTPNKFEWIDGTLLKNNYALSIKKIETKIDFLLCTYVIPKYNNRNTSMVYPTSKEIADAMLASGYQTYFRQNRSKGIVTSDDDEIVSYLSRNKT